MPKNQIEEIKRDIRKVAKAALKNANAAAENDLYEVKEQIVTEFYKYKSRNADERHGNLWNAIGIISDKKDYECNPGLFVNGNEMKGTYGEGRTSFPGSNVLDYIWNQGIRGLPEVGHNDLKKSYDYLGHHFEAGEPWKNPYWDPQKYNNEFRLKIKVGKFTSTEGTPEEVVEEFIEQWGNYRCDEVFEKAMEIATKK